MPEELEDQIREAAAEPAEVSVDGQTFKQRSLSEQIAADRYLESKRATRRKGLGIALKKLAPPGTV